MHARQSMFYTLFIPLALTGYAQAAIYFDLPVNNLKDICHAMKKASEDAFDQNLRLKLSRLTFQTIKVPCKLYTGWFRCPHTLPLRQVLHSTHPLLRVFVR